MKSYAKSVIFVTNICAMSPAVQSVNVQMHSNLLIQSSDLWPGPPEKFGKFSIILIPGPSIRRLFGANGRKVGVDIAIGGSGTLKLGEKRLLKLVFADEKEVVVFVLTGAAGGFIINGSGLAYALINIGAGFVGAFNSLVSGAFKGVGL